MSQDLPCISYMALYIVSMHIITSNSKTSTHWKLNSDAGKVQSASASDKNLMGDDPLMTILTNKVSTGDGQWTLLGETDCMYHLKEGSSYTEDSQQRINGCETERLNHKSLDQKNHNPSKTGQEEKRSSNEKNNSKKHESKNILDCGEVINNTKYDHLPGVINRNKHVHSPDPEAATVFKKKNKKDVDMDELERKLRKAKKEKPNSDRVYNQIGNYWRILGNTELSVQCFRKALSISPNNPDVLLNLARVLLIRDYYDDAFYLTKLSMELQKSDKSTWLHHFTLGEIMKKYGRYKEALQEFKLTLKENPHYDQAENKIRELEMVPDTAGVTYYTLFIILFLVLGVMCGILTSIDGMFEDANEGNKTKRHFNRAMAMRSIKLGIKPNLMRMRKQMSQ